MSTKLESILIILVVILVTWYFSKLKKEDCFKENKPLNKIKNRNELIKCARKDCKRYVYSDNSYCDNCIDNMWLS